jgi:hypothetical protein
MSAAQERNNILLNEIRDKIDRDHLKIDMNGLFRPAIGTFWSFRQVYDLNHPQMIDELTKIQSYITAQDKEYIFQKLEKRHSYVGMLLVMTVDAKVREIEEVRGSTIDALFYSPKQNGFKRMVHQRALDGYFDNLDKRQWLSLIGQNGFENFHATVLYGNRYFKIDKDSLAMSSNGKYVRAIDFGGNELIWDTEQGVSVELSNQDITGMQWTHGGWNFGEAEHYICDNTGYYTATLVDEEDMSDAIHLVDSGAVYQTKNLGGWASKAIMLYKNAQKEAWFVQAALRNSLSKEELLALLHSKTLAAVKGFPKENFKTYIKAKIDKL